VRLESATDVDRQPMDTVADNGVAASIAECTRANGASIISGAEPMRQTSIRARVRGRGNDD